MGKGRNKRRRRARKRSEKARDEAAQATEWVLAALAARKPSSDPPVLGEPDAPVRAPLRPRPNLRSGAIAVPEPEPEEGFALLKARQV